ncbi:hypothetical protein ROZALSC1DRAFT_26120, partial [Rozella allomycis CSF55]
AQIKDKFYIGKKECINAASMILRSPLSLVRGMACSVAELSTADRMVAGSIPAVPFFVLCHGMTIITCQVPTILYFEALFFFKVHFQSSVSVSQSKQVRFLVSLTFNPGH